VAIAIGLAVVVDLPATGHGPSVVASRTAAHVVWKGDYETRDFGQWETVLRETGGAARIVTKPVAQGSFAARYVLGAQTDETSSRVEAHQPDELASGGIYGTEAWYSWAEYVPARSQFAPHASFNHLVQWLPDVEECSGAALSVNGLARPPRLLFRTKGGEILSREEGCTMRYERTFDLGRLPRDRWLRFRLHVRWSADPSAGFVELRMNGRRVIGRTQIATAPPGVNHYLRQGIYRFRCTCRTVAFGDGMTVETASP
jgi:Polysaccharide lyase